MNRPLTGIPLLLFRVWLFVPVVLLWLSFFISLVDRRGFGSGLIIFAVAVVLLTAFVLFHSEFRQFERVTPKRILLFFFLSLALVALLVGAFSIRSVQSPGTEIIRIPLTASLIMTPALTILSNFALPKVKD